MNNDLISREALKEDLIIKFGNQLPLSLLDEIDNAPTVETEEIAKLKRENNALEQEMLYCRENWKKAERPQGEWIPVSERLPSDDEPYEVLCCDNHGEIMIGHPFADEYSECGYSAESECYSMYECIAWQPLPEPYKKGGAE